MYYIYFCHDNQTDEDFTFNSKAALPLGTTFDENSIIKDVAVISPISAHEPDFSYELMRGLSM